MIFAPVLVAGLSLAMSLLPAASDFATYEQASPDLLAQQPVTPAEDIRPRYVKGWTTIFAHLETRLNSMKTWRWSWWTYWSKLAEYILPRRYKWLITANLMRKGNPINQAIIDGTAGLAKNICYAAMVEGLVPMTRPWFALGVLAPDLELGSEEENWLESSASMGYIVLAKSGFYPVMAQVCEDLVTFSTAPVMMYEDPKTVVSWQSFCAGEYYCAVGAKNDVDTLYTEQTKTVLQLIDWFSRKSCPAEVQQKWANGGAELDSEYVLCMAVEPNYRLQGVKGDTGAEISPVSGRFAYREMYWLRGIASDDALSRRGFHRKPFVVFRWATSGNDPYGRGPGMDALGDIIQLQVMTRRKNEGIEKQVRPPMGADPALKNEPASINPGQITYTDSTGNKKGFWSLFDVKIDLGAMTQDMEKISGRIERYFYNHVFLAISRMEGVQPRNEREIAERKNEALQQLGPMVGLWKTDMHDVLEQFFAVLEKRHLLKPRPKSLQGIPLKFDFLDMVTLAQLGAETAAVEQGLKFGAQMSLAAKNAALPDPMRTVNLDETYRNYLKALRFPSRNLFTTREVHLHDQARMKVTQQRQAMAAPAATQPLVDAASKLAEIPPGGGNSVLSQIFSGSGGAAPLGEQ